MAAILMMSSVNSSLAQHKTGIQGKTYTNTDFNFRISIPVSLSHWRLQDNIPKLLFMMSTDDTTLANRGIIANLSVEAEKLSSKTVTLSNYLDISLLALQVGIRNLNNLIIDLVELGGRPAYRLIYTGSANDGTQVKFFQVIAVDQGKGYMLTGTSIPVTTPVSDFVSIQNTFLFLDAITAVKPLRILAHTWANLKK